MRAMPISLRHRGRCRCCRASRCPDSGAPMSVTKFAFPTTIQFGAGARKLVADHLKQQGLERPLIVTDKGLAELPMLKDFAASLAGLDAKVYAGVHGNP